MTSILNSKLSIILFLFLCQFPEQQLLAGQDRDDDDIKKVKTELKKYYDSLTSFDINYETEWNPINTDIMSQIQDVFITRQNERRKKTMGQVELNRQQSDQENNTKFNKIIRTKVHLIEEFPSMMSKIIYIEEDKNKNEDSFTVIESYLYDNLYTEIKPQHRYSVTSKNINLNRFPFPSPIHAIGKRVLYSINQSLGEIIQSDDTKVLGRKTENGDDFIEVQIGPNFTNNRKPKTLAKGAYIRITLNQSKSYIPIEIKFLQETNTTETQKNKGFFIPFEVSIKLDQYKEVSVSSDSAILFPFKINYSDSTSTTAFSIERVVLNKHYQASVFKPKIPDGFTHTVDGVAPTSKLTGGESQKFNSMKRISDRANVLLARTDISPSPKRQEWYLWILTSLGVASSAILILYLRRRRSDA